MQGSFRIGYVAGIAIFIHISWLIILVLLTVSLASGWFPRAYPGYDATTYLLLGLVAALLLFISVLLHELGHSLVARARGIPVKNIVLFVFGGVSNIEQEPESPGAEFQIAIIGPIVSFVIGILSFLLLLPLQQNPSPLAAILSYLAVANIILGVFNLIPGFPLDGGRVLRSILWKITHNAYKATRIATYVGQAVAYLFILGGIWQFFNGDTLGGIWIGFIGWFLLNAAQAARSQATMETVLQGIAVRDVMNTQPATVPANISLQKLIDDYFLPQGLRSALVLQGDDLSGLITLSDIRHVPRDQWSQTLVGFVMKPREQLYTVSPQQELKEVLPLMNQKDINQVPVLYNGHLIGVVSRDAVLRALELRKALELNQNTRNP